MISVVVIGICVASAASMKVRVVPKTGDPMLFSFEQRPEVAFLNGHVTITVTGEEPLVFDFEDIDHIKTQVTAAVNEVEKSDITVSSYPESIVFGNVPEGSLVEVYAISGQRILLDRAEGEFVLSRSGLSHGIYIVRINNTSFKVAL